MDKRSCLLKKMLRIKKEALLNKIKEINASINYINWKENFYKDVLDGNLEYVSNLIIE